MKNIFFLFFLIPFSLFAELSLVLNTENEPPFSMRKNELKSLKPDDPLTGISVDILTTLFSRVKLPYVMRIDSWDKSYQRALEGRDQGVFSTTRTKEREELFYWVGPLVVNDWFLVGKESFNANIKEIGDPNLKKIKIGTLKGGSIGFLLKSNGIPFREFENGFEGALALKESRIDLWAVGSATALYYGKKVGTENLKNIFLLKSHQFLYLALNKGIPISVVERLNRELGVMRRDGTIKDIYRKFRGF